MGTVMLGDFSDHIRVASIEFDVATDVHPFNTDGIITYIRNNLTDNAIPFS